MKLRKKIKRTLVVTLARTVIWMFNVVPRKLAIYIGEWVGFAVWKLSGKDQYKTVRHLSLVYGDRLTMREKESIGRSFFINMGGNLADVFRFKKYFFKEIKPLVTVEGEEYLRASLARGKGFIGITGHIGNFELLAAYMNSEGYKTAVVGREIYDKRLDKILVENREAVGLTNISTTDSPKKILRWLRNGNGLGVLIDTDSHRVRGKFIPAFGRWSNTPIGQTVLGLKVGADFFPMACLRTKDHRYKIVVKPPISIEPSGDFDTDVYNVTLACTRELEKIIDEHRDQWIWLHNRWRTKRKPLE